MFPLDPLAAYRWLGRGAAAVLILGLGVGAILSLRGCASERAPADPAVRVIEQATRRATADRDVARAASVAVETVYVTRRQVAQRAVADVARARDAKDSVSALVVAVAMQDTALTVADSLAARFARERAASDRLLRATQDERDVWQAIARRSPPRLSAVATALYDPLAQVPAASLQGNLRLTKTLSLVARADQRFAPGERARGYVGASVAF